MRRRSGRTTAAVAAFVAAHLAFPGLVPNTALRLGSLAEAFLPWFGAAVPVLAGVALWRRSAVAFAAVLLPAAAWLGAFGGLLLPADDRADLLVVQHNVSDENPDPAGTAGVLVRARPDLIGVEEVTPEAVPAYAAVLGERYPYHEVRGTVGLWSRHPLTDARPVDVKPSGLNADWRRGLRAVARTPHGEVAVYVAHLPSLRPGPRGFDTRRRDDSAARLGAVLAAEPLARVVLIGDLNATLDDRGLAPVRRHVRGAAAGFAFSWPAAAPVARIDQVMVRRGNVTTVRTLPRTGSDHLPIAARVRW